MFTAIVRGSEVPWQQVCTHWTGWKKVYGELLPCRLTMPISHVLTEFSHYWSDFVERESQDDGTDTPPDVYTELRACGYPLLDAMLKSHPSLFSALILEDLQTEFTGYVLNSPSEVAVGKPAYFLQSIKSLSIVGAMAILEGNCCNFLKPKP